MTAALLLRALPLMAALMASRSSAPAAAPPSFYMSELFSDDAILQHTAPTVGGKCTGTQTLTATLRSSVTDAILGSATAACGASGRFVLSLPAQPPSDKPHSITVTSSARIHAPLPLAATSAPANLAAKAVRVSMGTIILCGGQSNMGFTTIAEFNGTAELATARPAQTRI